MSKDMETLTFVDENGKERSVIVIAKIALEGNQFYVTADEENMDDDVIEVEVYVVEEETDDTVVCSLVDDEIAEVILRFMQDLSDVVTKDKK